MAAKSAARVPFLRNGTPLLGCAATHLNKESTIRLHEIKNIGDAVTVFDKMLQMKPHPSVVDYTKLLNSIVKMKQYSEAVLLFKRMALLSCPINEYTLSIVVNCYCRLKQVDSGFAVMATSLKLGYDPDTVSMSCLIKGLVLEGKVIEAAELLRKVIRERLCEVDEITTSIVLDGLCKSGNVVNAVQLLGMVENVKGKVNSFGYATVIDGLCKNRMVDAAMLLLSRMIERGFLPTVVTYAALIQRLCDYRRLDEAKKLLKKMIYAKVYPDVRTFTTLVDYYCKEGLIKDAEDVVEIMNQWDVQPDAVTYNALMDGYCLQGQLYKAVEVMNLMVNTGLKPNVISYGTIINGYCKNKMLDHAWKMFKELSHQGLEPDSSVYSTMIQGLFSVDRFSDILELYTEMENVGLVLDAYTYGIVLSARTAHTNPESKRVTETNGNETESTTPSNCKNVSSDKATMSSMHEMPTNNQGPSSVQARVNDIFREQFLTESQAPTLKRQALV